MLLTHIQALFLSSYNFGVWIIYNSKNRFGFCIILDVNVEILIFKWTSFLSYSWWLSSSHNAAHIHSSYLFVKLQSRCSKHLQFKEWIWLRSDFKGEEKKILTDCFLSVQNLDSSCDQSNFLTTNFGLEWNCECQAKKTPIQAIDISSYRLGTI